MLQTRFIVRLLEALQTSWFAPLRLLPSSRLRFFTSRTTVLTDKGQVGNPFTLGAAPIGTLSNRFTVYKDPYFPRNKILVGYKGGSYLETGYVYAPYVPLIVTPTIFAPEDFTPRKGVMTRYGKRMVRADFYGTVTVQDMSVI